MSRNPMQGAQHYSSQHASRTAASHKVDTTYIIDAVEDQFGNRWIKCGTVTRFCWLSVESLQLNEKEAFSALARVGITCLTSASKQKFKQAVEQHEGYRSGLVATHPGWLNETFVTGDGSVIQSPDDDREVICTFQPNFKFASRGTLSAWQEDVGRVVVGQPRLLFVLCYAFVGPVLKLAPSDVVSPQCEIVGKKECGKTTLAALATSVWAGNPDSDVGGGESWDVTLNGLETLKREHAWGLLHLDERNLSGANRREQQDVAAIAPFKFSATGSKRRLTDTNRAPDVKLSLLSTSNVPMIHLLRTDPAVRDAILSRIVTILIPEDHPYGVLTHIPDDFNSAREAMEYLRRACDENYGVAIKRFLKRLTNDLAADEVSVRNRVKRYYDGFLDKIGYSNEQGSARVAKLFAVTYAAGRLAKAYGVFPKEWGSIYKSVFSVYRLTTEDTSIHPPSPLTAVREYMKQHRDEFIHAGRLKAPLSDKQFRNAVGFVRRKSGYVEVLIPTERFQDEFPNYRSLMQALRDAGLVWSERGEKPKLSIKTPKAICNSGRVYCIRLHRVEDARI